VNLPIQPTSPLVAGLSRAVPNAWRSVRADIRRRFCRKPREPLTVSSMGSNLPTSLPTSPTDQTPMQTLLRVRGLCKKYVRGGMWRKRVPVAALSGADFEIQRGETLALVGDSGSGKSTVARCVTRLERPDSGQILIHGKDIAQLHARELLPFRSGIQMVFQDAVTSMNPRFSALEVVEEPLLIYRETGQPGRNRQSRRDFVSALMVEVGLSPDWMHRSILHFSGGQRQRLALARALALRPQLLVLDEALSGLDVSTQAQITNLLLDLQAAHSLTYLLISHDLSLVARLADVIGVMSGGRTVEVGPTEQMISSPNHAATKKLLASAKLAASNLAVITGASA
jgi:ABC-type glutathione transport system ATPase component